MFRKVLTLFTGLMIVLSLLSGCGAGKVKENKEPEKVIENKASENSKNENVPEQPSQPQSEEESKEEKEKTEAKEEKEQKETANNKNENVKNQIDPIKKQLQQMSLDEKIGQMLIVGIEGSAADDRTKEMIQKYHAGGIILFKKDYEGYKGNVKSADQLLSLLNSLKSLNAKYKIPLFLSVDEEGGRVSRMPDELEKLPTNQAIGKINRADLSLNIGSILGEELKSFGFNMDFAPVLDINSNPNNPVIGDRSFGTSADIVSKLGIQTMKGIQSKGIISVVKHFPGHGDTSIDSHVGLPEVSSDIKRLERLELIPFAKAINSKADAVMVAHILLPKIDAKYPSSLSKIIITGILRKKLRFNGVVISDDMTMGAITKNYSIEDAAVRAVKAGTDIILVCHGYDNEIAAIRSIKKAVTDGVIAEKRIDESVYRILSLKKKYKLSDKAVKSIHIEKINDRIRGVKKGF